MNWKALTKTARRTLSRNSSKILLGFGIAGAFTAVGFAITATPKAMILLDEKKKELGVEKLDAKTIVKTAAPVYIPTAISMAVSTGCIIGASSVNDRRNAALAAAYTMSETALRSYQDKVAATIGEDKAQEIKEAVTLEKMAKCPEPDEIPTAKNLAPDDVSYDKKVKCWESLSGKYFWTTRNAIEKALNGLNKQLLSDLSVTENDLYDYLGMEHCKNGDLLGWDTQSCMMVDSQLSVLFTCDRGVANELVRHRIASFAQESTRYCNYSKEKFESSITVVEPFYIDKEQNRLFYRKWVESCELAEKTYFLMLMNGYRPEQARCVLPLCLKTEIVVTANYREWRNIFKLRTPVAAHPQMRELMCPLLLEVQKKIPVVFDDIYTFWPADDQTRKGSMVKE